MLETLMTKETKVPKANFNTTSCRFFLLIVPSIYVRGQKFINGRLFNVPRLLLANSFHPNCLRLYTFLVVNAKSKSTAVVVLDIYGRRLRVFLLCEPYEITYIGDFLE